MRALDLFCCGGGASKGLVDAGFDVTGMDVEQQPHYPYEFVHGDVRSLHWSQICDYDFVWASPPCQRFTKGANKAGTANNWPDLIGPTRRLLEAAGVPFVIENVPEAFTHGAMRRDLMLCGSMFDLRLIRHRIFEVHGFEVEQPEHGEHHPRYVTVAGNSGGSSKRDGKAGFGSAADWREAMGIDWLPISRLREAIPPAYSQHIGAAAMAAITERKAA